jgi:hypothetical protein
MNHNPRRLRRKIRKLNPKENLSKVRFGTEDKIICSAFKLCLLNVLLAGGLIFVPFLAKVLVLPLAFVEAGSSGGNNCNPVFARLPYINTVLQTFVARVSLARTYIEFKYEIPTSHVYMPEKVLTH